jgi:hypothetical protein
MEESVTYQAIIAKGVAQGAIQELKKTLRLLGRKRFGPPDSRVLAALDGINDIDQLERLAVRILDAASWDELLQTPRRRNRRRK